MNRWGPTDSKLSLDDAGAFGHRPAMEQEPQSIELERRMPERNMARFYVLELDRDLFGMALARRRWGRIGTRGRSKAEIFSSTGEARAELRRLERIKRRRGYVDRCGQPLLPDASA